MQWAQEILDMFDKRKKEQMNKKKWANKGMMGRLND